MKVIPNGSVGVMLTDAEGETRAGLMASEDMDTSLMLSDAKGNERLMLTVEAGGDALLGMLSAEQEERVVLAVSGDLPGLLLTDSMGNEWIVHPKDKGGLLE